MGHSRTMRVFLSSITAGLLLLLSVLPAHALVTIVDGTNGDTGHDSSLQMNGGKPVISYFDWIRQDLRLATCIADCLTASATWMLVTVDSAGDVGTFNSLALKDGNPLISYRDVTTGTLKLATCVADCATSSPTWVISIVDRGGNIGTFSSLLLNNGNPVIAYRDVTAGDLKLATCTGACASASPTWIVTTVDSAGDTGRAVSMKLRQGNPVIAYLDVTNGTVKVATCTANCATPSPSWVITTVSGGLPDADDVRFSLQLDANGNPIVSYQDIQRGALRLATCSAGCASASPTWAISTVEASAANIGQWSSLQLAGGIPIVAYNAGNGLRLATCTAGCGTASATWRITHVNDRGGFYPSLQVVGGSAVITYYDFDGGDLRLAIVPAAAGMVPNYQALWWNSPGGSESGWGVNITHQGDTLFATWFTYDLDGSQMWLVMSNGAKTAEGVYSGALHRTNGPTFSASPWSSSAVVLNQVGTATFAFGDANNGVFSYTLNGITAAKPITRQVFGTPVPDCTAGGTPGSPPNFQDLWWKSPPGSESGWGVNLTHQGEVIFATWFTYDASGRGMWLVMSDARRVSGNTFTGAIHRTRGPAFNAVPWTSSQVSLTDVGSGTFSFSDANNGVFSYSVEGVSQTKAITRQVYASPATVCR